MRATVALALRPGQLGRVVGLVIYGVAFVLSWVWAPSAAPCAGAADVTAA
jgi:hypothetical protein